MRVMGRIALPALAGILLAGCGGGEPPPPPPKPPTPLAATAPGAPVVRPRDPDAGPPLPAIAFDPKGRRDPFVPVSLPAESKGINLTAAKLVGVVQSGPALKALVEGSDGIGYILKVGDALGNGRVTGITTTSVTFAVAAQPGQGPTTVTLRLALD